MEDCVQFHRADAGDLPLLRAIAYHSEAHWGYDSGFMRTFEREFNITEAFLTSNPVYVGKIQGDIVGFWGVQDLEGQPELEYFYIAPAYMNRGIGKEMWRNLTFWCREHEIPSILFVTSPQAVGFYEKMGAAVMGERRSAIDGRRIPLLEYKI